MSIYFDFITELTRAIAAENKLDSADILARELYTQSLDEPTDATILCEHCTTECEEDAAINHCGALYCCDHCAEQGEEAREQAAAERLWELEDDR